MNSIYTAPKMPREPKSKKWARRRRKKIHVRRMNWLYDKLALEILYEEDVRILSDAFKYMETYFNGQ